MIGLLVAVSAVAITVLLALASWDIYARRERSYKKWLVEFTAGKGEVGRFQARR